MRWLDLLFAAAISTPVSLLLYLSIEATSFSVVAEPLAAASWVGLLYEVARRRDGDGEDK